MSRGCVYDNPNNLRREWWIDGKMEAFVVKEMLARYPEQFVRGYGPWKDGQIKGSPEALPEGVKP